MPALLVSAQLVLIAALAWPATTPDINAFNLLLFGAGIVLVTAAAFAMGPRTLSVSPRPRAGAVLITRGIYRVVRHPMYLAVLLCALAAGLAYHNEIKWLLAAALALVLLFKIRYEERLLRRRFSGYAAYAARTSALLPFIW